MANTKLTTFRLTPDEIAKLDALKAQGFSSRTDVLRHLIASASTEPAPQLLTDSQPNAHVEAIEFVSAKGVSPPIQQGQTITLKLNGITTEVGLHNCCASAGNAYGPHRKSCPLKQLGYVDLPDD